MAPGRTVPRIVGLASALAAVGAGALLILVVLAVVPVAFFVACLVAFTIALALVYVRAWRRAEDIDPEERSAEP